MTSHTDDIGRLNQSITELMTTYRTLEDNVSLLLKRCDAAAPSIEELLDGCDEFGAEHAIELLFAQSERHDQSGTFLATKTALITEVQVLIDTHDKIDVLVRERDECSGDGLAQQHMFIHGREYTIDALLQCAWPTAEPDNRLPFTTVERVSQAPELQRLAARKRDLDTLKIARATARDRDR